MNGKSFERFMRSVDDELLDEAVRPQKKKRTWIYTAGSMAACLAVALGLLVWKPWTAGDTDTVGNERGAAGTEAVTVTEEEAIEENADIFGEAYGFAAVENPVRTVTAEEIERMGYKLPLPDGASGAEYTLIDDMAQVNFVSGGVENCCRVLKCDEPTDISGIYDDAAPELSWEQQSTVVGLHVSDLYGAWIDWYDGENEWCVSADNAAAALYTAREMQRERGFSDESIPDGATDMMYDAVVQEGKIALEKRFTLDGVRYVWRMASTGDIGLEDISGTGTDYDRDADTSVEWCAAHVFINDAGDGKIIWFDLVPGLLYSLTMSDGATEEALVAMANEVWIPAQGDCG